MWENALRFLAMGDANARFVLLGSLLIGGTGGLLGAFTVLRRRSLVGDALAHAALPGVALAFLLTGSKALPVLVVGATISGVAGVLVMQVILNYTRIKADSAIGIVLSVFFGIGIVLLTHIQRGSSGNQSGLDKFLFGQAASIVEEDLKVMSLMAGFIALAVILFYKEFKGLIFDQGFMQAAGFSVSRLDLLLMGLVVMTVMVGLQAVGVVLIAAMLITPAVAARFWTGKLYVLIILSAFFGSLSGAVGTFLSSLAPRVPTGPVMVLVATVFFVFSAVFGPRRGLLARLRQHRANVQREMRQHFLRACIELAEERQQPGSFSVEKLAGRLGWRSGQVERWARRLGREGLVGRGPSGGIALSGEGLAEGLSVVKSHRLWEHYLVYRDILDPNHVDRPADEVEHLLTPAIIERLEELLRQEGHLDSGPMASIHQRESGYRRGGRDD
ncbi:MAG: zinc ABC transporter permease [Candidatus Latescibacteria bacterium]|nr:zinc ABC transporter permease [Candidatus Latescibacterota bacterium]